MQFQTFEKTAPVLSVVVPCFNEEAVIEMMHDSLVKELRELCITAEIIYVDDGSGDATLSILRGLDSQGIDLHVIALSRNFGHQIAVTAGIDAAVGEAVVLIDADLQDPPSVIPLMLEQWRQGYDVIYGRRRERVGESFFKRKSAHVFYGLLGRMSSVPIPIDTGDFRLMSRRVVDSLRQMPERDRFIRGMVSWVGFRQCEVLYDRDARRAGTSKYPLRKMIRFACDGLTSFSTEPLRAVLRLGLFVSATAFAGVIYALIMRIFTANWVSGWTLLIIAVLLLGGFQLVCLGVIGEYVARIYQEVKRRPLYFVSEDTLRSGQQIPPVTADEREYRSPSRTEAGAWQVRG